MCAWLWQSRLIYLGNPHAFFKPCPHRGIACASSPAEKKRCRQCVPGATLPFRSIPYDLPSFLVVILLNSINQKHRGGGSTLGGRRAQRTFPRRGDVCRGLEGWDALVPIDQRGAGMYYVTLCLCRKRPLLKKKLVLLAFLPLFYRAYAYSFYLRLSRGPLTLPLLFHHSRAASRRSTSPR